MNSIGVFLEKEIDGRTVFSFNFLSQTQTNSSSSSADLLLLLQPDLFICPVLRRRLQDAKQGDDPINYIQWDTSPEFPCTRSDEELISSFGDNHAICKLPVVPLFWCNTKNPESDEFECGGCRNSNLGDAYYFCSTCQSMFHKECVECPLEIRQHPSYPFSSLKLYSPGEIIYSNLESCFCCGINLYRFFYHSLTYKVSMHTVCAMKPVPFLIDHPKMHRHSLSLFPKQTSLCCDVCGLKNLIPTYICVQCVFVVHQNCIHSPKVIRICRHHHRLSFTLSLPSGEWVCGVCRREVDTHYGAYSCKECSSYFVHAKCALRKDLWDGKDLEGVPEEPEIYLEPFQTIAEGVIHHFSHDHHLKLEISARVYDEQRFCQACIIPIYEGNYYSCVVGQCEFTLHEACANAPRMKRHALHSHPLTLKVVSSGFDDDKGFFECSACRRKSCSFVYEFEFDIGPNDHVFRLDLRCASVSEPFEYQGHAHPLFLALTPEEEKSAICQVCQGENRSCRKLNCIECEYVICFWCATLPYKAKYKHDKHLLTFREREEESDHSYWCEVCERRIEYSRPGGFYVCDDCCTTLHVHCLIGEDPYLMKPGQTIMTSSFGGKAQIISNKTMSRPFCQYDGPTNHGEVEHRCPYRTIFQSDSMTFCSCLALSLFDLFG